VSREVSRGFMADNAMRGPWKRLACFVYLTCMGLEYMDAKTGMM
jgi:hypothetical protein